MSTTLLLKLRSRSLMSLIHLSLIVFQSSRRPWSLILDIVLFYQIKVFEYIQVPHWGYKRFLIKKILKCTLSLPSIFQNLIKKFGCDRSRLCFFYCCFQFSTYIYLIQSKETPFFPGPIFFLLFLLLSSPLCPFTSSPSSSPRVSKLLFFFLFRWFPFRPDSGGRESGWTCVMTPIPRRYEPETVTTHHLGVKTRKWLCRRRVSSSGLIKHRLCRNTNCKDTKKRDD